MKIQSFAASTGLLLSFAVGCPVWAQGPQNVQQQGPPPHAPAQGGSSVAPQNITWSLGRPPERLRFPDKETVDFSVTSADKELQDVRLVGSTLQDTGSYLTLDVSQLQLCAASSCGGRINIPANTTEPLMLKIAKSFRAPGAFTGEISLCVGGKPEPQSFKLTVYSRRPVAMFWGAMAIAVGLGFYFVLNLFLRLSIARDEALFPAYQLRESIKTLNTRVEEAQSATKIPLPALVQELNQLDEQLTPEALAGHLPTAIVLPWASGTAWQDNFKSYLSPVSDKLAGLVVLVNSGVRFAQSFWDQHSGPAAGALSQIDALAPLVTNAATAQAQLAPILKALLAAVNPPQAAALAPLLDAAPSRVMARFFTLPPDINTLGLRLFRNTLWVWWLVALVALAGGFYALVLLNLGFGSPADYLKCFFWGLGFSVAGTQLDQLTQSAVATNFGSSIPKA